MIIAKFTKTLTQSEMDRTPKEFQACLPVLFALRVAVDNIPYDGRSWPQLDHLEGGRQAR